MFNEQPEDEKTQGAHIIGGSPLNMSRPVALVVMRAKGDGSMIIGNAEDPDSGVVLSKDDTEKLSEWLARIIRPKH